VRPILHDRRLATPDPTTKRAADGRDGGGRQDLASTAAQQPTEQVAEPTLPTLAASAKQAT
jgi:hypothetical protein